MALAVTSLNASGSTTDAASGATASVSPAGNSLLVLWVCYAVTGGGTITSVSGLGLTWTQQSTVTASSSTKLDCWAAVCGPSPGSGAVTFNFSVTMGSWNWDLDQVTGQDPVTPLVTSNTKTATATTTTNLTLTFNAAAAAANLFMLGVGAASNVTETPGETPAWTELVDESQTTPSCALETQVSPDATNTAAQANPSATSNRGGIGIELAAAAAAARVPQVTSQYTGFF